MVLPLHPRNKAYEYALQIAFLSTTMEVLAVESMAILTSSFGHKE
jgi:hypothetical protein